jgi:tetratricopeptide (TPR) repeat protein
MRMQTELYCDGIGNRILRFYNQHTKLHGTHDGRVSTMSARQVVQRTLLLLVLAPVAAGAQVADPKAGFTEALAQFSLALDGSFGDEGPRIVASLDALDRGLAAWDDTIHRFETAMPAETRNADPKLAALAHLALGGVYLDRGRSADALREFTTAGTLDPARADAFLLQGVASAPPYGNNSAAALAAFQKASTLDPSDVVSAYLLARQLAKAGRAEDAAKAWRRLADVQKRREDERAIAAPSPFMRFGIVEERSGVEPFFPPALYAEGFALLARGEYAKALTSLRASSARDPLVADQANRYGMRRAADAFRDGSIAAAVEQLEAAIEISPERAEPRRVLGLVWAADEQFDRAVDALKTAIRLNAGDERAQLALADVLVRAGQADAAEAALRETIARFTGGGRAHYTLARLYQRRGQQAEALKEFQTALSFTPLVGLNGIYQTMGAMAAARQNFDAAIDAYSKRVDVQPNAADAHQELGDTYARLGRSDEALAEFAVALAIDDSRPAAYASLAQLHLREGRYEDAVSMAQRALALDAGQPQTHYALGTALMRLGRTDDGERELKAFEQLQQEEAAARARDLELGGLRREAQISSGSGDYAKSVELLRRAMTLAPGDPVSYLNLGMALMLAKQPADAVEQFLRAVALNGPPETHQHLSDAYAALGRDEDSRRELELYAQIRQGRLQRTGPPR